MDRYDSYLQRMQRLAAARNFLRRHRIIILSSLAAIGIATAALMGTKGAVTDATYPEPSFVYGEEYDYHSSAFLSDVQYQFSPQGSDEWTSTPPKNVGSYKMRVVTSGSFGVRYGEPKTFEILPREASVSIVEDEVIYGEPLHFQAASLLPGHSLSSATSVIKEYKAETATYASEAKIVDEKGEDVSANYRLSYPEKALKIKARSLSLKQENSAFVYDGQTHDSSESLSITSGSLAEGDTILFTPSEAGLHVGSYDGSGDYRIVHGEEDRTALYNLTLNPGKTTISAKSLSLSSPSFSKTYDGHPIALEERGEVTHTELAVGDTFTPSFSGDESEWVFPGTYQNEFSYTLGNENDYNIQKSVGTITITNRPLSIGIKGTRTYNGGLLGGELTDAEFSFLDETSLAFGDTISISIAENQVFAANPQYVVRISREDVDVTKYYNLTLSGGLLFEKGHITATGSQETVVYDGKPHELSYSVTGVKDEDEAEIVWGSSPRPTMDPTPVYGTSRTVPGAIYATPTLSSVKNKSNNENREVYYDFEATPATLVIKKRGLVILLSGDRTYDGTKNLYRSLEETEYSFSAGTSLAEGDSIVITPVPASIFTTPTYEYHIYNAASTEVTTTCYNVTISDADSITYGKKSLQITANQNEFVYDGQPHELGYTVDGEILSDQYEYSWDKPTLSLTSVGEIASTVSLKSVYSTPLDMDVTAFYDCEPKESRLTITSRPLSITLTANRTYDGTNTDYSFNETSPEVAISTGVDQGLVTGHHLTITPKENKTGINLLRGEEMEFDVRVYDGNSADVTSNYEIDFNYEVSMAPATGVTTALARTSASSSLYYHRNLTTGFTNTVSGLLSTDKLQGSYTITKDGVAGTAQSLSMSNGESYLTGYTDVGTYECAMSINGVKRGSEDRTVAYQDITGVTDASFTILPRPISIYLYAINDSIDGEMTTYDITSEAGDGYDGDPLGGDFFSYTLISNGDGTYSYTYDIRNGSKSVLSNYNVVNVTAGPYPNKTLTINCISQDLLFGERYTADENWYSCATPVYITWASGSAPSNSTFYEATDSPLEFGSSWKVSKLTDHNGIDVTNAFTVNIVPATVTIRKRVLNIELSGTRKYAGTALGYNVGTVEYSLSGDGLYMNDTLTITPTESTILDNGSTSDDEVEYTYTIRNSSKQDIKSNYVVTLSGKITYETTDLHLSATVGEVVQYDRKSHEPTISITGLCGSDKATVVYTDGQSHAVSSPGESSPYTIQGATVKNGTSDRTKYYNTIVDQPDGDISIDVAVVMLELGDYKGIYDGVTSYNVKDYLSFRKIVVSNLQTGHYIAALNFRDFYVSNLGITELDENCVDLESLQILDQNGNDVTHNYSVNAVVGTVKLVPFSFGIYANSVSKTYDGTALTSGSLAYKVRDLAASENVDWGDLKSYTYQVQFESVNLTNVGTASAQITGVRVYLGGAEVDSAAYSYNSFAGTLTIKSRHITIYTANFTDEAGYAVDPAESGYGIALGALAPGDRLDVVHAPTPRVYDEAGNYENSDWAFTIVNSNGEDVSANYSIAYSWGTIRILAE